MRDDELKNRIRKYIRKTGMLKGGDRVLICLSGGADSVFLFYVLKDFAREMPLEIRAVHVHHGIRGEEADRDEKFVTELCARENVPLEVFKRNIPEEAARSCRSLEEAGRIARYECFREAAEKWARQKEEHAEGRVSGSDTVKASGQSLKEENTDECAPGLIPRVALAHHMDDQAETVLFRIARGTGLAGLKGMEPVRRDFGMPEEIQNATDSPRNPAFLFIRPLLCVRKTEIREYLINHEIKWVEDSTNAEKDAARNRIRNEILPLLTSEVNTAAVEHLAGLAERAAEADEFFQEEIQKREDLYICGTDSGITLCRTVLEEPAAMQKALAARAIGAAAGGRKDIGEIHILSVLELLRKENGRRVNLPYGLEAVRTAAGVTFRKRRPAPDAAKTEKPGKVEESHTAPEEDREFGKPEKDQIGSEKAARGTMAPDPANVTLEVEKFSRNINSIPRLTYTKWLDYDKMNNVPSVRTRERGDFLTIDAAGHRKTLSDYFTDEKVPKELRGRIPLVADGHEIAWVVGYRIGYRYRVSPETRQVLIVSYLPEEADGDG